MTAKLSTKLKIFDQFAVTASLAGACSATSSGTSSVSGRTSNVSAIATTASVKNTSRSDDLSDSTPTSNHQGGRVRLRRVRQEDRPAPKAIRPAAGGLCGQPPT